MKQSTIKSRTSLFTFNKEAFVIAITYIFLSALWILFSDRLLLTNPATALYISTVKGWLYTVVIGIGLYSLIARGMNKIAFEEVEHRNVWDALRKSDKQLKLTLEATGIGTWDWDLEKDIYYASSLYFTMLGYEPEEGPVNRAVWIERTYPDDRETLTAKIKNVLNGEELNYEYEVRMMHADGSYRWVHAQGFVTQHNEQGKATHMLGVRMDATKRKETEEKLEEKVRELERLNGFMVNREIRMSELKDDLEKMKKQAENE